MSEASGEVGIFTLVDFCRALIGEGRGQQQRSAAGEKCRLSVCHLKLFPQF